MRSPWSDDGVLNGVVGDGVVVGIGVEGRESLVGEGHAVFGGVELGGEGDVEEAVAFVGGGVIGAADDDAGSGADDFGFGGAVGIGDEAEDVACIDDAAEGCARGEDAATGGALPVAFGGNDRSVSGRGGFALGGEHFHLAHHGEDPLDAEADRRGIEPEGFAAFEEQDGFVEIAAG